MRYIAANEVVAGEGTASSRCGDRVRRGVGGKELADDPSHEPSFAYNQLSADVTGVNGSFLNAEERERWRSVVESGRSGLCVLRSRSTMTPRRQTLVTARRKPPNAGELANQTGGQDSDG